MPNPEDKNEAVAEHVPAASGYQVVDEHGETHDITDAEYAWLRARVNRAVDTAVARFEQRRGIVNFSGHHIEQEAAHAEVRMIARWGARVALGLERPADA